MSKRTTYGHLTGELNLVIADNTVPLGSVSVPVTGWVDGYGIRIAADMQPIRDAVIELFRRAARESGGTDE